MEDDVVVNEVEVDTEPKGADTQPNTEPREIVFDELDDDIKKFIDRERTKASKTAREKAYKDPQFRESVRREVEEEAKLSAEDKLRIKEEAIMRKASELSAKAYLMQEANLFGEELDDALELIVSTDEEKTLAKAEKYVKTLKKMVTNATELEVAKLVKQPKPKTQSTQPKAFKDMSFDERVKLKQTDPARYKAEMAKVQSKI